MAEKWVIKMVQDVCGCGHVRSSHRKSFGEGACRSCRRGGFVCEEFMLSIGGRLVEVLQEYVVDIGDLFEPCQKCGHTAAHHEEGRPGRCGYLFCKCGEYLGVRDPSFGVQWSRKLR